MANKLSMPMSSWSTVKQIIRAYGEVQDIEKPTVDKVAEIVGLQRSVVSANNNFLRETGIVQESENKPTPLGARLASALTMENEALVCEALQEIVRSNVALNRFLGIVRARGPMKLDLLKGEIALTGGIKQIGPTKPILDMLEEAKLIQIADDTVKMAGPFTMGFAAFEREIAPSDSNGPPSVIEPKRGNRIYPEEPEATRIPLPLGPTRLAYIQLPADWQPKELSKLIKILQIALGEDDSGNT
jgi:hypothetical protein